MIPYICSKCGEVESFNPGVCPLCNGRFKRQKKEEDKEFKNILNKVSGIFDTAYEFAADDEERDYINKVENELYQYFKEKDLI